MNFVCIDLEGVLVPEIWIEFSIRSGLPELRRTTRDEPDYAKLMKGRLEILDANNLKLSDIQKSIAEMGPIPGAREFLDALRQDYQVLILSDTFYDFAMPLMRQLNMPTLLCHKLIVKDDRIVDYKLRLADQKRQAIIHLRQLNFLTVAIGDSYNDTAMLGAADGGILYNPPANVAAEFPQYPVVNDYTGMRRQIDGIFAKIEGENNS